MRYITPRRVIIFPQLSIISIGQFPDMPRSFCKDQSLERTILACPIKISPRYLHGLLSKVQQESASYRPPQAEQVTNR